MTAGNLPLHLNVSGLSEVTDTVTINSCNYYSKTDHKSPLEENVILVKELRRQQELIKEIQQDHKFECEQTVVTLHASY